MSVGSASGVRQLALLLGLWWRHMRRRPRRLGDLPKQSGVPTFLLINLLSLGYMTPLAFSSIKSSVKFDLACFAWHALGIAFTGLGAGLSPSAVAMHGRTGRNDLFLEAMPLALFARVGLSLLDGYMGLLLAFVVPLAGTSAAGVSGAHAVFAVLFGWLLYLALFLLGGAARAWLRVLGPPSTARITGYCGTALALLGLGLMFFSLGPLIGVDPITRAVAHSWLVSDRTLAALYALAALLAGASYTALALAERRGFDRVEAQAGAARKRTGVLSRIKLEALMVWRQGGKILLITFTAALVFTMVSLEVYLPARVREPALLMATGMMVYLGSIQAIALAGRAARSDLVARPFLSALPLAPHQVLDGKAAVLRRLLIPVFCALVYVAFMAARAHAFDLTIRAALATLALYLAVAGAVAVAFMSSGVGVAGVAGGQAGSSFSTQLLLMPLMATVFAPDSWAATVSLLAVAAVTWEAQRAAGHSIRWIDDPDDHAQRETSVWRALLAATVFFSTQALSTRILAVFEVSGGYLLAIGFVFASGVLMMLTVRSSALFSRPRIAPRAVWYWPLGLVAGALSGKLALEMMAFLPKRDVESAPAFGTHESAAVLVATVVVAPLAEEYFFRGWLQQAIAEDLPVQHKRWAFVIGAVAFALAHVGTYGVPQLVLGLIAGALFARGGGLAPGMLAHAAHNAVVMWFAIKG